MHPVGNLAEGEAMNNCTYILWQKVKLGIIVLTFYGRR
jgi:hypothetical protein